jgi:hypothetical protein
MDTFANVALWSAQGFLALFFVGAGVPKILGRGLDRWTGFSGLPRSQVVFTGITEVLAAAGLMLPMATGTLPWLTPLAAVGIAIISLMAAGFHLRANEYPNVLETSLLASIAAAVAIGRWDHLAAAIDIQTWMPAAAVVLLIPAAITTVIALFKGPADQLPSSADHPSPARLATNTR